MYKNKTYIKNKYTEDIQKQINGAEGLGFNSQAGQSGHNVANGSPPLRRFFEAVLPRR